MIFNSLSFAIFLPVVFVMYWFVTKNNLKLQNFLLLVASYFFYACWDWRFLFLLIFSTLLDYYTGLQMSKTERKSIKKFWFLFSVIVNLGFLAVFKYYNFFISSFTNVVENFGIHTNLWTIKVILPVGISFYTFHGLSYVIDIFKNRISPEKNFVDYAVFVSFFPLLVAGPIERATHLLPQIKTKRNFDYITAVDGLKQILWGLFKKVVIADTCADAVNIIFDHSGQNSGAVLAIGAILFSFQIYGDFSGYSDIALGTAKLFGINLLRNFAYPYFSRDIAEFWRRWHISLSTWFRDYLYIPLGGSKGGELLKVRNTFIIFIVSGFWHGANWTFIVWGVLHAFYFLPLLLSKKNRNNLDIVAQGRFLPQSSDFFKMLLTFSLTTFAWIFFRSATLDQAFQFIANIFKNPGTFVLASIYKKYLFIYVLICIMLLIEWIGRDQVFAIHRIGQSWSRSIRWTFYLVLTISVLLFQGKPQTFIYFQF